MATINNRVMALRQKAADNRTTQNPLAAGWSSGGRNPSAQPPVNTTAKQGQFSRENQIERYTNNFAEAQPRNQQVFQNNAQRLASEGISLDSTSQQFGAMSSIPMTTPPSRMPVDESRRGGGGLGGAIQSGGIPLRPFTGAPNMPLDQIQRVGSLQGDNSLAFSSENPQGKENLFNALNDRANQDDPFLYGLEPEFAKKALTSSFEDFDASTLSPTVQSRLKGAEQSGYGGSGFGFASNESLTAGVNAPLGIEQRNRVVMDANSNDIANFFRNNVATGQITATSPVPGHIEFSGSFGDVNVDNAYKAMLREQASYGVSGANTTKSRLAHNERMRQLKDELANAQLSATMRSGSAGQKFAQDLDLLTSVREDSLMRRDQDQLAARSTAGVFDLDGVDKESRIDAMEKQGLDKVKEFAENQKATIKSGFDQQKAAIEQKTKSDELRMNQEFDDLLEKQLGNFSDKFKTDAFGNLTPSGAAFKAKIISDVEEQRRRALDELLADSSFRVSGLISEQNEKILDMDSRVSQAEIDFFNNQIERQASFEERQQKAANDRATKEMEIASEMEKGEIDFARKQQLSLQSIQGDVLKEKVKAQIKEEANSFFNKKDLIDFLTKLDRIDDPDIRMQAIATAESNMTESGFNVDLDSVYASVFNAEERRQLDNNLKQRRIDTMGRSRSGSGDDIDPVTGLTSTSFGFTESGISVFEQMLMDSINGMGGEIEDDL